MECREERLHVLHEEFDDCSVVGSGARGVVGDEGDPFGGAEGECRGGCDEFDEVVRQVLRRRAGECLVEADEASKVVGDDPDGGELDAVGCCHAFDGRTNTGHYLPGIADILGAWRDQQPEC